jgi:hypothetical protein
VFSGNNYRSSNTATEFQVQAKEFSINILARVQFSPGETDMFESVENTKAIGARIFVIFATNEDGVTLLSQGYSRGLFREDTQIISMSSFDTYLLPHRL